MAAKLTETEVQALRDGWNAGETAVDLAARFGVTVRHAHRLVADLEHGVARSPLEVGESAEAAMRAFLVTLDLDDAGRGVLAAAALTVAVKLDRADARSAAGLASRLQELVGELRSFTSEPDELDLLNRRRALRRVGASST